MARFISCKYCGKSFSSDQVHCPHCGLNRHGYQCLICRQPISSPHDSATICFLPKGYSVSGIHPLPVDVGRMNVGHKEWAYHATCLQQIRHLPYGCPVCKTRLSHLDMGAMTEQLRRLQSTQSEAGYHNIHPTHREQCPNCGHPIPIVLCMFCREAVIADDISGKSMTFPLLPFTKSMHEICMTAMTSASRATEKARRWWKRGAGVFLILPALMFVATFMVTHNIDLSIGLSLTGYLLLGGLATFLRGGLFWVEVLWVITESLMIGLVVGILPALIFVVTFMVTHHIGLSIGFFFIGYLLIGGLVTLLTRGVFCAEIALKNRNRLNYIWAIPVDIIIAPIFWAWCFVEGYGF